MKPFNRIVSRRGEGVSSGGSVCMCGGPNKKIPFFKNGGISSDRAAHTRRTHTHTTPLFPSPPLPSSSYFCYYCVPCLPHTHSLSVSLKCFTTCCFPEASSPFTSHPGSPVCRRHSLACRRWPRLLISDNIEMRARVAALRSGQNVFRVWPLCSCQPHLRGGGATSLLFVPKALTLMPPHTPSGRKSLFCWKLDSLVGSRKSISKKMERLPETDCQKQVHRKEEQGLQFAFFCVRTRFCQKKLPNDAALLCSQDKKGVHVCWGGFVGAIMCSSLNTSETTDAISEGKDRSNVCTIAVPSTKPFGIDIELAIPGSVRRVHCAR
eukprot:TRINITY_DN3427_c3_g2_i1.p1 TRINITY_DN3427_c3_g2~~TRINITY_DN3427_c3_g2_i1.p1  ORF type:complete len:322 (+),score=-54.94 TRINITY_DN3427_c3_g2_i1:566-1531(+)